jgi:hypothetical protein
MEFKQDLFLSLRFISELHNKQELKRKTEERQKFCLCHKTERDFFVQQKMTKMNTTNKSLRQGREKWQIFFPKKMKKMNSHQKKKLKNDLGPGYWETHDTVSSYL